MLKAILTILASLWPPPRPGAPTNLAARVAALEAENAMLRRELANERAASVARDAEHARLGGERDFAMAELRRHNATLRGNCDRLTAGLAEIQTAIEHREAHLLTLEQVRALRKRVHDLRAGELHASGDEA